MTLVVLIDDLDRCLPETTISTLEAIRLFLFLKNTAFVIAADNDMIKHAVRRHFEGVEDDLLVTNYFDKPGADPCPAAGDAGGARLYDAAVRREQYACRGRPGENQARSLRPTTPNLAGQAGGPGVRSIPPRGFSR